MSRWPVLALVAVLVLAAIVFGWLKLRQANDDRNSATTASCFDGERTLIVAADPAVAPALGQIADRYGETNPVVRDQCITVLVQARTADEVVSALAEDPAPDRPGLWVAQSGVDVELARTAQPDALSSASRSLATSPILVAVPAARAAGLAAVSWQDLPARQSTGELGLALPGGADSGATTLALSAVVAAVTGETAAPLTAEEAASGPAREALSTLRAAAPAEQFASTADTLAAAASDSAGVLAVPVTEQQLYQAIKDDATPPLHGLAPAGATPVADFPAVTLSAADADETLSRAASSFLEFARQPAQLDLLASAGFQTAGGEALAAAGNAVTFDRPQSTLPTPGAPAIATINPRRVGAAPAHTTTVLLDVSGSMREVDGDRSRMLNVTDALRAELAALPDDSGVGLWRYSSNLNGSQPYAVDVATGSLGEPVDGGESRRAHLDTALSLANPVSATHTYRSLEAAYVNAVEGFQPGQANSVLLITDGPNDDQAYLDSSRMLRAIAAAQDPARPVVVNVIVISPNPDLANLQAVADQTGGTLTFLDTSATPELGTSIHAAMG